MNRLILLTYAALAPLFAVALNACATPYGNTGMAAMAGRGLGPGTMGAQQALMGQQGMGMMGMPFGMGTCADATWQYRDTGLDPCRQQEIALWQAWGTVWAVSPNGTVFHPMPQPSAASAVGTASQAAPVDGYATQAQLRVVAGRVHRNAEEAARAIETLRRQRR